MPRMREISAETMEKYVVGKSTIDGECRWWHHCHNTAKYRVKNPSRKGDPRGDEVNVCGVHRNEMLRSWQRIEKNTLAAQRRNERVARHSRALNLVHFLTEQLGIPITADTGYTADGKQLHIDIETAQALYTRGARIEYTKETS